MLPRRSREGFVRLGSIDRAAVGEANAIMWEGSRRVHATVREGVEYTGSASAGETPLGGGATYCGMPLGTYGAGAAGSLSRTSKLPSARPVTSTTRS